MSYARLMFIGKEGSGKSSLLDGLMGKPFEEGKDSTPLVEPRELKSQWMTAEGCNIIDGAYSVTFYFHDVVCMYEHNHTTVTWCCSKDELELDPGSLYRHPRSYSTGLQPRYIVEVCYELKYQRVG